jgi:hypothetical protein
MFLLYHSEGCSFAKLYFCKCYINEWRTIHAVVCRVTAAAPESRGLAAAVAAMAKRAAHRLVDGLIKSLVYERILSLE